MIDKFLSTNTKAVILRACWTAPMAGRQKDFPFSHPIERFSFLPPLKDFSFLFLQVCVERCGLQSDGRDELPHDKKGIQNAGFATAKNSA